MGLRHAGRELALKALYQRDIRGNLAAPDLALLFEVMPADAARVKAYVAEHTGL